ncbi:LytTR family transcriptional regulator DNA-binding domain-containing protein [Echinicola marina]|uniref:LytR/AlgR family response regulator transcription factor n=1 Tax=Echinicola marina TaxID=2859768 RepID=UPI001CF67EF5|nr:response regulator [Echinicola marina]UCS93495.1 LytTR family transcriptional regulator DNA-binding domain-containing protein [Echinicola marina]
MIKTIIIDDEPLAAQLLEEYLEDFTDFQVVEVCSDGFRGIKAIQAHEPDIVFLDVQMPRINGFEMLELLDHAPAVIFTTAYDEFAMRAFDAQALDYLLKPFSKERFAQAVNKFLVMGKQRYSGNWNANDIWQGYAHRIVVKERGEIRIIPVDKVAYLEANDDYVNIFFDGKRYMKNKPLKYFEEALDPKVFVRVHRSYIVRVAEIAKIETYEKDGQVLRLRDDDSIPVSKNGMVKLKKVLGI